MKVLIFPTATGQGHNRAAEALKEVLDERGADTVILDALNVGREKSGFISRLYDRLVRYTPFFFGALYRLGELISSPKHHSPIYYLNTLYTKSLLERIKKIDPQVIVCPHMFSAHSVTRLIEKGKLNVPTVAVITDYTCSPFWEETKLDLYLVANEAVADECVSHGMDKNKIAVTGIPVSSRFNVKRDRGEARREFGVSEDAEVFVIMGGSMGYGGIPELTKELSGLAPDASIVAVCGNNKAAYEKIKNMKNVTALSYISNVDTLMDAADVLLTKPGGLSTTEAMTKRVPFVITKPIPGGEVRNSRMIASLGMAILTDTIESSAKAARGLAKDKDAQAAMISAQGRFCNINAARDAGELILKAAKK